MKGKKRNNAVGIKGRSGRKGYGHEAVIEQAYIIVQKGLRGELKTVDEKQQFAAAVELVKKALPTNVNLSGRLEIMFDELFKTTRKTKIDNTEQSEI